MVPSRQVVPFSQRKRAFFQRWPGASKAWVNVSMITTHEYMPLPLTPPFTQAISGEPTIVPEPVATPPVGAPPGGVCN